MLRTKFWKDLKTRLDPAIEENIISVLGFEHPMPVQFAVIPLFLKNYDIAVEVFLF